MDNNVRTLKILSSAQITLNNVLDGKDGYTVSLSNENHSILCNKNGDPMLGELGISGKAICSTSVISNSVLTAVNTTPGVNQYSITIKSTIGCTANKKDASTFYIDTVTTGMTGKVVIEFNIENKTTIIKEMSFVRIIDSKKGMILNDNFAYEKEYWGSSQNGTGSLGSNCKVIKSTSAKHGTNILEVSGNQWVYSSQTFDVEDDKIYKITFRIRQTLDPVTGGKIYYVGLTPYDSNDAAIGTDGTGNLYFINESLSVNTWKESTFYISKTAKNAVIDSTGKVLVPAVKAFPTNTTKFRPMFIVNYNGGNGIAEVDGYILEDATEEFNITELKNKTVKLETDVNGINASVTTIKTITDMSTNPMTLQAKVNYSAFSTINDGEFYLHGLDSNRKAADVDGVCLWNNNKVTLPKAMYNPNGFVPDGTVIYIVRDIAVNKWWCAWEEITNIETGTKAWKKMLNDAAIDSSITNANPSETTDIVVGYFIIKKTVPKSTEAPVLAVQLFDGALTWSQATTMSLSSSVTQLQLLEDQMELKVQKDQVIASINLYTQQDESGTTSGIKISGDKIDLEGKVTFSALSDRTDEGGLQHLFNQAGNKTTINGGHIDTNTITADSIDLLSGIVVKGADDKPVFAISKDEIDPTKGKVEINGLLHSSNFNEELGLGYEIRTDGTAVFNQARISGDVILPNAGITNSGIANSNIEVLNSTYRNFKTAMVVTNSSDRIYSDFEVPPPIGAVFNNYDPHSKTISNKVIDSPSLAWTIINLSELCKVAPTSENMDLLNKVAMFTVGQIQNGSFYGATFKFMPNGIQIESGSWKPITTVFHTRNQDLMAYALLLAYETTSNATYRYNAEALLDQSATWYQNIDTRITREEIPSYLSGCTYNVIVKTGDNFAPQWNVSSNCSFDAKIMACNKYIELFGDATRKDAENISYTISEFKTRIKNYLSTNVSKLIAPTGHKLLYCFARSENWDINYDYVNWDFLEDVWGKTAWFTTDLMLWGIYGFALCGLQTEAIQLIKQLYSLRSLDHGNDVLIYDRYTSDGIKFDNEVSVDFTGLMYGVIDAIGEVDGISKDALLQTCIKYQITQPGTLEDGSYYWNTFLNEQSVTETKTMGEVLYYTKGLGRLGKVERTVTRISEISPVRFWAGAEFEQRDIAPFRVMQNGDVFAKNGTYEGLLRGTLDSGDIQIYNNAITVHSPNTEQEIISLKADKSWFNTQVSFGDDNVVYSKENNALILTGANFRANTTMGTVLIDNSNNSFGGLNIIGPTNGHHIIRGSNDNDKSGTLIFDSEGNQGQIGDFSFTRKNYAEKCRVDIDGDLNIYEKITSQIQKIEFRSVKSADGSWEGWGFYAI